jgi:hypothetical protein
MSYWQLAAVSESIHALISYSPMVSCRLLATNVGPCGRWKLLVFGS